MGIAHRNGQGAAACPLHKLGSLIRIGEEIRVGHVLQILTHTDMPQLRLHIYAEYRGGPGHLAGHRHILLIRQGRAVHHDGWEAVPDAADGDLIGR